MVGSLDYSVHLVTAIVVAVAAASIVVSPAFGQETIFDPENPGDESEEEDTSSGGESLIIEDPEHPDFSESDEFQPEPTVREDEPRPPQFRDTEWSLDYELGALIHPGYEPTGQDDFELVAGLGMSLRHELSSRTNAVISGRFHYWAGSGHSDQRDALWRARYEPRLDRAYVVHRAEQWSIALGKMRNSWGSTDITRPGDVIDPVDIRDPSGAAGLGSKLSQFSATASYSGQDWSIRAVLVPFFQGNRVALIGRDTALAHENNPVLADQLPVLLLAEELLDPAIHVDSQAFAQSSSRPPDLPHSASAGLRGSWTVDGTDLGFGVFYGWDRTPWIEFDEDMREALILVAEDGQIFVDFNFLGFLERNPEFLQHSQNLIDKAQAGQPIFETEFLRKTTVLADFARYIGPIGVRGDVAFSPRQIFYTTDFQPVRRASVFSAVGLSYERLIDGIRPLALTLEGFWMHPFAADSTIHELMVTDDRGGDTSDELLLFDDGYYGFAGAVNWGTDWWDTELTFGGVASIAPGDFIGRVALERPWGRGIRTTLGANFFFGPDPADTLTAGGMWAHNDRIHLAIHGQF